MKKAFRLAFFLLLACLLVVGMLACTTTEDPSGFGSSSSVTEPTRISLSKNTLTLEIGANETLIATITPATASQAVTWSSSMPSVATIGTDGNVVAVSQGISIIFATTTTGERTSCVVTVLAGPEPPPDNCDENGLVYLPSGDGYIVTDYIGTATEVVVPATYKDKAVHSIGDNAFAETAITHITLPESIIFIAENAFDRCSALTGLTVPANVIDEVPERSRFVRVEITGTGEIPQYAFNSCDKLTTVIIGNGVTKIGNRSFAYCDELTSVSIGSSVTTIGTDAFNACQKLTSITLPESVTVIESSAFMSCSALQTVNLPSKLVTLGASAFYGTALRSIAIPSTTVVIEQRAFANCTSLESVLIGNGVTTIKTAAFSGCTALRQISFGNTITSIQSSAFSNCTALTEITLGSSLTSIGSKAFAWCYKLTSVVFQSELSTIGTELFYGSTKLASITNTVSTGTIRVVNHCMINTTTGELIAGCKNSVIPSDGSVTIIAEKAFAACAELTEITIPASVTKIAKQAFENCKGLTTISLPTTGLVEIEPFAFERCTSLTALVIPNSVTVIGDSALSGCSSLVSLTIPFLGNSATVSNINSRLPLGSIFGATSYTGGLNVTQTTGAIGISRSYYIPATLRTVVVTGGDIPRGAFQNCSMLTSITIPESATQVGLYAFAGCAKLTSITIPEGVTQINAFAFQSCSMLEAVIFAQTEGWQIADPVTALIVTDPAANAINLRNEDTDSPAGVANYTLTRIVSE